MSNSKSSVLALILVVMSISASASRVLLPDKSRTVAVVLAEIDGLLNGSFMRIEHATLMAPNATVLADAVSAASTLLAAATYPPTDGRARDSATTSAPAVPLSSQEEYDLLFQIIDCSNATLSAINTVHGYLGDAMDDLSQAVALGSRLMANYRGIGNWP